jgi:hypothetical protein
MKSITSILAVLAVGSTLALADDKPAAPAPAPAAPAAGDAAKPKRDPAEVFKKLDANGDGKVSLEEFKAGPAGKKDPVKAEENFKRRDKDNDGFLTLEEFSAAGGKKNK